MVIKRKSRKGTKLHESNNLSLSICAWIRNQLSGTSLSHEFYSVKLVSASHQRGMNEPFVMIMTLKEGELCYLIHRVYSSLDRPIIPIIANGCSKLTSKKDVPLCGKGKGLSLQASLSFNRSFLSCLSLKGCASPLRCL